MAIVANVKEFKSEGFYIWKPYPVETSVKNKITYWLKKLLPEVEIIDIKIINGRRYIPWN